MTASGLYDRFATPVSGELGPLPGVYIHANVLDTLLTGREIEPAGSWLAVRGVAGAARRAAGRISGVVAAPFVAADRRAGAARGGRQRRGAIRRAALDVAGAGDRRVWWSCIRSGTGGASK